MDVDGDNNNNRNHEVNSKKTENRAYSYSDPPVAAVEGAPSRRSMPTLITHQLEVSGRPRTTTTTTTLSTDTDVSLLTPRSTTSSPSLSLSLSPSLFYPRVNSITSGRKLTPWERSASAASWCSNSNATSWTKTAPPAAHTIPSASSVDPFNLFGFFPTAPMISVAGVVGCEEGCKEWDWLSEESRVDSGKTAEEESYHDDCYYTEAEWQYEYRLDDGRMMEEDKNTIRRDIIREGEIGHIKDVAEQVIDEEDKFGVLRLTGGKIAWSVVKDIGSLVGRLLGFGGFVEGVAVRDYYSVVDSSREDMEGVCWRYRCERKAREEEQVREQDKIGLFV